MRLLRVGSLACLAAAVWVVLVFVPVYFAVSIPLRALSENRSPSVESAAPPDSPLRLQPCPPMGGSNAASAATGSNRGDQRATITIGTLPDDRSNVTVLGQCGEWVRIQESPAQWLHLANRTIITVDDAIETTEATKPAGR